MDLLRQLLHHGTKPTPGDNFLWQYGQDYGAEACLSYCATARGPQMKTFVFYSKKLRFYPSLLILLTHIFN